MEKTSTDPTAHMELDSERERNRHLSQPPPPHVSSTYPSVSQTQQPFQFPEHFQTLQQQALAHPMLPWQAQPPYHAGQPDSGSNYISHSDQWAGHNPMMSVFSSQNQHLNLLPVEGYAQNPVAGQNIGGNRQRGFDVLNAIRNQETSTQLSYSLSNTTSNLGEAHTSATSQSQPEAFESEAEALLGDLTNARLSELDLLPLPSHNPLYSPPSFELGEDGGQEGGKTGPLEH
ncbi:hypothetical protein DV736_g6596, partial [Chaetothyriales sp. CBS 134916]